MKERGMIFNADMVRAILAGRKTQTRRPMKNQPQIRDGFWRMDGAGWGNKFEYIQSGNGVRQSLSLANHCPFGLPGDRLWVRETFATLGNEDGCPIDWNGKLVKCGGPEAARIYRASCEQKPGDYGLWSIPDDAFWKPHTEDMKYEGSWVPSIHMPRWASRITLKITGVRVERLKDISASDALDEGIQHMTMNCPRHEFFQLWNSIYGDMAHETNPWIWVITFRRVA